MKILLIPLDFHRDIFDDMVNAFKDKHVTTLYKKDMVLSYYDIILFQGGLTPDELFGLKLMTNAKVIMYTGDIRYVPQESLMLYKKYVDKYLIPCEGDVKDIYELALGKPCDFMWEGIQDWRFVDPREMDKGQIAFVGNSYPTVPGREDTIEFLYDHCEEFISFGDDHPIANEEVPKLYNESYAVICENNWQDIKSYFTPRNLGAMAAGSCPIMKVFPNIERFFTNWKDCIYYKNKFELLDIIEFLKKNPDIRNRIAKGAYESAVNSWTFKNYVKEITL